MARRIKKVEASHAHHGGAWKVAYADFVTAMMALFMVLWLLASTDQQSLKEISNYFRTGLVPTIDMSSKGSPNTSSVFMSSMVPAAPAPTRATGDPGQSGAGAGNGGTMGRDSTGGDDRVHTANALMKRLNRFAAVDGELAAVMRNVHVQVTSEGIMIEAVDEGKGLLFDMASSRLNEPLERFLRAFAPAVVSLGHPVEINGHTDARPFVAGSRLSNWDLSYQRATKAREILESSGVPPGTVVGVFARGSSQLYTPDNPYSAQNRRLSFLIKIAKSDTDPVEPATK